MAFKAAITAVLVWYFSSLCHLILSPWKMAVGRKKMLERHIKFSFRILSVVLTTLNCAGNFPLSRIRNYIGTICTSQVKPVWAHTPGQLPQVYNSLTTLMLGQKRREGLQPIVLTNLYCLSLSLLL